MARAGAKRDFDERAAGADARVRRTATDPRACSAAGWQIARPSVVSV